jgi:hypothetical protein
LVNKKGRGVESKVPFVAYDFWAYLSAGFLLLFGFDSFAGTRLVTRDTWTVVQTVLAVSVAYAVGQLVASASSVLFERLLVGKALGYPRLTLFGQSQARRWVRRLLPTYFDELPAETRAKVLEKAKAEGITAPGESLFLLAFAKARETPAVMSRLDNFLNMHGFARNIALVALVDAALFYWSYMQPKGPPDHLLYSRLALGVGVGMLYRYLKFFRLYAHEVFTSFAYAKEAEKKA